jgi:hypothetical protein
VLDAIEYALAGKSSIPGEPIRRGETEASVVVELDDIIVKRTFSPKDSYLTVEGKEGQVFKSPQSVLDKLVGELTFDPLAFSRRKPAEQAEILRGVLGLDFTGLDMKRDGIYAARTDNNRSLQTVRARVSTMPQYDIPDAAQESVDSLLENAMQSKQQKSDAVAHAERAATGAIYCANAVDDLRGEIAGMEMRLMDLRVRLESYVVKAKEAEQTAVALREKADAIAEPDLDAIKEKRRQAEEIEDHRKHNFLRFKLAQLVKDLEKETDSLTKRIAEIDQRKAEMLQAVQMPVSGLGFGDAGVTMNGLPFEQASSSEQLRVSVAMGAALNPKLRVMLIRDGSLLDANSLKLLEDMAEKHDLQIWLERVSDGDKVGVVIADGMVYERL